MCIRDSDQPDVVEALRLLLKANGFSVVPTSSPAGVLGAVETEDVDVILMDLNYTRDTTSGREGLELLAKLHQLDPQLPVVVMTAWGSVEGAVDAMRAGARDYVTKPWDNTRLVTTLRSHVAEELALEDALAQGAFTDAKSDRTGCFELGDQGTLFMDEVANMPLGQQAKLLRVLQTGEFHPVGSSRVE